MTERQTHELFVEFMRMCQRETRPSNNNHIDRESQALAESKCLKILDLKHKLNTFMIMVCIFSIYNLLLLLYILLFTLFYYDPLCVSVSLADCFVNWLLQRH